MPSLNNVTVTAKFRCHPSSRPPRPRPASRLLGDFTAFIKTRTLERAPQQRGSSQDRFLLHSITGHWTQTEAHRAFLWQVSCVFSPSVLCLQSGSGAGVRGTETGDTSWGW